MVSCLHKFFEKVGGVSRTVNIFILWSVLFELFFCGISPSVMMSSLFWSLTGKIDKVCIGSDGKIRVKNWYLVLNLFSCSLELLNCKRFVSRYYLLVVILSLWLTCLRNYTWGITESTFFRSRLISVSRVTPLWSVVSISWPWSRSRVISVSPMIVMTMAIILSSSCTSVTLKRLYVSMRRVFLFVLVVGIHYQTFSIKF